MGTGSPPEKWAALMAEIMVSDYDRSLAFWTGVLGFDIAFLRPDLPAMVKITAYDFSIYGGLKGHVEQISADTIIDDRGERFYRVRVRTEENSLGTAADPLRIIPGMTAQVDVITGEKTVLDYLLDHVRWDVGKDRVVADLWNDDR